MIYGWFFKLKAINGSIEPFMWNLPNGLWGEEEVEQRSAGDPLPIASSEGSVAMDMFYFLSSHAHAPSYRLLLRVSQLPQHSQ